jgi:hypothetical protein
LSSIPFNLHSEDLTKEVVEGFGDIRIGGNGICTVKCVDELLLPAKDETALQGMIGRLIENEKSYVLEMNVESNRSDEGLKSTIPSAETLTLRT